MKKKESWKIFQSTPSYEGERSGVFCKSILSHFNPLPHTRENFVLGDAKGLARTISIHSLIRGRTRQKSQEKISQTFQSTPSYEGELNIYTHLDSIYKFQSTPSYEGEQCSRRMSRGYSKFQSTPSYEGEQ